MLAANSTWLPRNTAEGEQVIGQAQCCGAQGTRDIFLFCCMCMTLVGVAKYIYADHETCE